MQTSHQINLSEMKNMLDEQLEVFKLWGNKTFSLFDEMRSCATMEGYKSWKKLFKTTEERRESEFNVLMGMIRSYNDIMQREGVFRHFYIDDGDGSIFETSTIRLSAVADELEEE